MVTPRYPPHLGGVESYAAWVARTCRDAGHEVLVLTTAEGRHGSRDVQDGIDVVRLGSWFTVSNTPLSPLWWWQVRRVLRTFAPDVVNVHSPVPGLADLTAYAAGRTPVVMTYHSGSLVKGVGAPVDALLRAYERHVLPRVFRRCDRLVAVSPVSTAYATGRAEIVPPGVDVSLFTPGDPAARDGDQVLFVGRLETTSRWKGVHVLIDAIALLAARRPGVRLVLAGDGDDVPSLRAQVGAAGIEDRVTWLGSVPHHDLPPAYHRAAVTVLPSLTESESFGMSLVEAMACACPVIGSDVGGIPFVVRDGVDGVLAAPGDVVALAAAIESVLADPVRASALGAAGRRAAEERWSWTRQEEHLLRVLTP